MTHMQRVKIYLIANVVMMATLWPWPALLEFLALVSNFGLFAWMSATRDGLR